MRPYIDDVQQQVQESGEVSEALDQLVYWLEYAHNQADIDRCWETFQDRMKIAVSRARQYAEEMREGA